MTSQHIETLEDYSIPNSYRGRTAKIVVLLIFSVGVLVSWRFMGPKSALASGGWNDDWDIGIQQSLSSGKPALVLFSADWCPACRQFESVTLGDHQVQQYLRDNYTLISVDLSDRNGPSTKRAFEFKVNAIPTLILYDQTGHEKARGFGMPRESFMLWLQSGGTAVQFKPAE